MANVDENAMALLADAGITGEDARTAMVNIGKLLDAGVAEFGSDAGRAAKVLGY